MSVSLGMNGFGRIGRYLLRLLADSKDIRITAINARADNASLAHLFKYDSVYGIFPGTVDHDDNGIIINGRHIEVTRCKTGEWEWARLGIDIAVETTGTLKKREDAAQHLQCGAKKVVVSAPCKEADATIVMGVNDDIYDAAAHTVLSAASCTTNCLAPVAKVLNDAFGIRHGLMTTIHSYTMSQRILDGSHKDLRRARAACVSMIPTSTGAANVRRSGDYVSRMIEMAGGTYIFPDLGEEDSALSTVNMDMETFYVGARDADVLIYNSTIDGELHTVAELLDKSPLLADFKAVETGDVWCTEQNLFQSTMGLGKMIADIHTVLTQDDPDPASLTYLHRLEG